MKLARIRDILANPIDWDIPLYGRPCRKLQTLVVSYFNASARNIASVQQQNCMHRSMCFRGKPYQWAVKVSKQQSRGQQ